MHTLGSQSLTQISTKLERERKGRRWIFNLSSTPTKGTQSLLKIWHIAKGRRERRGTLAHQEQQWGMRVVRKRVEANLIPSRTGSLST